MGKAFPSEIFDSYWIFISLPILTILIFQRLNLYKTLLKYIGTRFILNTFLGTTMSCLIHGFLCGSSRKHYFQIQSFPFIGVFLTY